MTQTNSCRLVGASLLGLSCLFACQQTLNNPEVAELPNGDFALPSHLPAAPDGYEWRLVDKMSDEFSENKLDETKWADHINSWQGRPPAEFLRKNVSVDSGKLTLRTSTHPNPSEKWQMAGAAVKGKHHATYGYFESRIKTSRVKMSTTFWLHSDGKENADQACEQQHAIEIDILEAIGGWFTQRWTHTMNSNTHYKQSKRVDGKCRTAEYLSKGVKKLTDAHLADNFNVFSVWWQNPNEMVFYFNGVETGKVKLSHEQDALPFDGPMSLRMVSETYDWQHKFAPEGEAHYPTDEELDDSSINTALYDYVRTYELVAKQDNLVKNGDFENKIIDWKIKGERSQRTLVRDTSYTHDFGMAVFANESVSQQIPVNPQQRYQLSLMIKTDFSNKGEMSVPIEVLGSDGKVLAFAHSSQSNFVPMALKFIPSTDNIIIKIGDNQSGIAYIDNVSVEQQ